ncbi:MAG: insulinase family protein, partial [Proteobacteria bacterium]
MKAQGSRASLLAIALTTTISTLALAQSPTLNGEAPPTANAESSPAPIATPPSAATGTIPTAASTAAPATTPVEPAATPAVTPATAPAAKTPRRRGARSAAPAAPAAPAASPAPTSTEKAPGDIGSQIRFPVEKYKLANGLTVLLHEDHSVPLISYQTWFRVGSKNEQKGLTGMAHLFEHMMFRGAKRYTGEQFDTMLQANGAQNNAFTTNDYTGYYENL